MTVGFSCLIVWSFNMVLGQETLRAALLLHAIPAGTADSERQVRGRTYLGYVPLRRRHHETGQTESSAEKPTDLL